MKKKHTLTPIYETSRLAVNDVKSDLDKFSRMELLNRVVELFSPKVVKNLPPYFQNVTSLNSAEIWFNKITTDSRLLVV